MKNLSELLADFIIGYHIDCKTTAEVSAAKRFFGDCYGCMVAGAHEPSSKIALDYARQERAGGNCTVAIAPGLYTDSGTAAFVCATASHAHDYDDVSISMTGHPSVVVMPAVLSVGEETGAGGSHVLEAYMLGVDVAAALGRAFNPEHYARGWHNTATLGVFGAAAASGKLLGLGKVQLINMLGIAASMSSGLKANFGTLTKPVHAGFAAAKGIWSAKLAQLGLDANPDIFEAGGGFGKVTTGSFHISESESFLLSGTSEFLSPGLAMKPYPSCKATHNGISAVLDLREEYKLSPDEVLEIQVYCQPIAMDLLRYPQAEDTLQGKFSMNYCLASALVFGEVTLQQFENGGIIDPRIKKAMKMIHMSVDESIGGGKYHNGTWETSVTIVLKDGRRLTKTVKYAPGDAENPLSYSAAKDKLLQCLGVNMDSGPAEEIARSIEKLESIKNIKELICLTNSHIK